MHTHCPLLVFVPPITGHLAADKYPGLQAVCGPSQSPFLTLPTNLTPSATATTRVLLQVPAITGQLAADNTRAYRRYAALAQVLSLGHAAVSVTPEVLLLSDPLVLLHQQPTDVAVMSGAWGDERMAYGEHVLR